MCLFSKAILAELLEALLNQCGHSGDCSSDISRLRASRIYYCKKFGGDTWCAGTGEKEERA